MARTLIFMEGEDEKAAAHAHHAPNQGAVQRLSAFLVAHKIYALAAVIYLIIALVNFWPVTAHPTGAAPPKSTWTRGASPGADRLCLVKWLT